MYKIWKKKIREKGNGNFGACATGPTVYEALTSGREGAREVAGPCKPQDQVHNDRLRRLEELAMLLSSCLAVLILEYRIVDTPAIILEHTARLDDGPMVCVQQLCLKLARLF